MTEEIEPKMIVPVTVRKTGHTGLCLQITIPREIAKATNLQVGQRLVLKLFLKTDSWLITVTPEK